MQSEAYPVAEALPLRRRDRWLSWLKGRERSLLLAAVGLQVFVLLALTGMRMLILARGETVLLRLTYLNWSGPYRDDHATLNYEFSQLPPGGLPGLPANASELWRDRPVYVTLIPDRDGRHWRMGALSLSRPTTGGKYMQGQIKNWNRLEFGIESYLVSPGERPAYEQAARERRLSAEVALTPDGQAALRGLHME